MSPVEITLQKLGSCCLFCSHQLYQCTRHYVQGGGEREAPPPTTVYTTLYSLCCYDKGVLTPNFRSASVKLIPKKGEATQLKNWRPISLLSNFHKIISRAINNCINCINNQICSRAQKGFNNQRYTQECLINVIETIQHCHLNNVEGALVAVDMAKAFDTLSHGYLREVFNFFNLGPNIIKWLTLLGENRTACILLDNGEYSRPFDLGRGRAKGDNISQTRLILVSRFLSLRSN
jgi:hypothetical protein